MDDGRQMKTDHKHSPCHYVTAELIIIQKNRVIIN